MLLELIRQYRLIYDDYKRIDLEYLELRRQSEKIFDNNKKVLSTLDSEINAYLNNLMTEIKLLNYILVNIFKIDYNDFNLVLNTLDDDYEKKCTYIQGFLDGLNIALEMEVEQRFYVSRKRFEYLNDDKYQLFKNFLMGFNDYNFKEFITGETIFGYNDFYKAYEKLKDIPYQHENCLDKFLNNSKNLEETNLPHIINAPTFLRNIEEFVKLSLIESGLITDSNNEIISKVTADFYKLLFQKTNPFIKKIPVYGNASDIMIKEYREEPFLEQVEKVKYYIKK